MKIRRFFGGLGSFLFFLAVLIIMILLSSYNPRAFWILVGALALVTVGLILLLKRISARRAAAEAGGEETEGADAGDAPAASEEIVVSSGGDPMAAFYEGAPESAEDEEDPGTELPAAEGETRWEPGERRVGTDAEPGVYAVRVLYGEGYLVVSRAKGGIRVASPMGRCDYERADTIPDLKLESGETITTDGTLIIGIRKL